MVDSLCGTGTLRRNTSPGLHNRNSRTSCVQDSVKRLPTQNKQLRVGTDSGFNKISAKWLTRSSKKIFSQRNSVRAGNFIFPATFHGAPFSPPPAPPLLSTGASRYSPCRTGGALKINWRVSPLFPLLRKLTGCIPTLPRRKLASAFPLSTFPPPFRTLDILHRPRTTGRVAGRFRRQAESERLPKR